jgi:hypothetical protein
MLIKDESEFGRKTMEDGNSVHLLKIEIIATDLSSFYAAISRSCGQFLAIAKFHFQRKHLP